MNKKLIFSVLLVICLLAVVTVVAFAQTSPNARWEYMVVQNSQTATLADKANELGAQGWELIIRDNSANLIFKRRLP